MTFASPLFLSIFELYAYAVPLAFAILVGSSQVMSRLLISFQNVPFESAWLQSMFPPDHSRVPVAYEDEPAPQMEIWRREGVDG